MMHVQVLPKIYQQENQKGSKLTKKCAITRDISICMLNTTFRTASSNRLLEKRQYKIMNHKVHTIGENDVIRWRHGLMLPIASFVSGMSTEIQRSKVSNMSAQVVVCRVLVRRVLLKMLRRLSPSQYLGF